MASHAGAQQAASVPPSSTTAPVFSGRTGQANLPALKSFLANTVWDELDLIPASDEAEVRKLVGAFYDRIGQRQAWFDGTKPTAMVNTLFTELRNAAQEGLRPEYYKPEELAKRVEAVPNGEEEALRQADVNLTTAMMVYGMNLFQGRIRPGQLDIAWHAKPRRADLPALLAGALEKGNLSSVLASLRPRHPEYGRLRELRLIYAELASRGGWRPVPGGPSLKPGELAPLERLRALRQRLAAEGYLGGTPITGIQKLSGQAERKAIERIEARKKKLQSESAERLSPTSSEGVYDQELADALGKFQLAHGIEIDNILGPQTLAELNLPIEARLRQIELNLERWRWLPDDFGVLHVRINVPAFHLEVMQNGVPVLDMNVIVGKEGWGTPVFSDEIEQIIVNPDWTVPDSIVTEELLPKLQQDPLYLMRNNFDYLPSGRLRQKPGPQNPLGRFKFLFPNEYSIYLHDTPRTELFDKRDRALSHGCIRLERPLELAALLLRGEPGNWTQDRLKEAAESGRTQEINLEHKIPVHLHYWTVYSREGAVEFHQDILGVDKAMIEELESPGSGARKKAIQQHRPANDRFPVDSWNYWPPRTFRFSPTPPGRWGRRFLR